MDLPIAVRRKGGRCWVGTTQTQAMRTVAPVAPVAPPLEAMVSAIESLSSRRSSLQTVGRALGRDPQTADVAQKLGNCALRLATALEVGDTDKVRALLTGGFFCQQRLCPICEWRRTRAWRGRLIKGLARFGEVHPTHRAIFATFTVRNVPIHETGATIKHLHASFRRMTRASFWPSPFWLRRTEVTLGKPSFSDELPSAPVSAIHGHADPESTSHGLQDDPTFRAAVASPYGLWAHPHVHSLILVPASYFSRGYVRQTEWQREWAAASRLDYAPVVDVRPARSKGGSPDLKDAASDAVMEAAKYITKGNQIGAISKHAAEMHLQLRGQRMIQLSQKLSHFVKAGEIEQEEMLDLAEVEASKFPMLHVILQWEQGLQKYTIAP